MDKFFKDKNGRVVIVQWPNIYLWLWFGLYIVSKLLENGEIKSGFQWAANALLVYWALKEVLQGASYFRRLLGIIIGVSTTFWFIRTISS